ncbi:MAG: metal-dependent phosphohydrolase [Treponema sp.]|nr:metal-dependent phosphohydrolase [Treponema sp.]
MLETKGFIDICLKESISVICINSRTKKDRTMPFNAMYGNNKEFWRQHSDWNYFFSNDDLQRIYDKMPKSAFQLKPQEQEQEHESPKEDKVSTLIPITEDDAPNLGYGKEYEAIAGMNDVERVRHINKDKERLENLMTIKPRQENLITEALVETARDAILHNHASLVNAMSLTANDAKKQTQDLVDSTRELVKASIQLISTNIFNNELMNALVLKSNGTIIQHMTRVYLNGLAFLSYFNKQVSSSHVINKIRVSFDDKYRRFYQTLLPHIHPDHFTLERIFLGGMRAINEIDFYNWATGFLIHDIGKATAVEYHEGEAAYNRDVVTEHVRIGFANVVGKTNYPQEAALITGYHHEYYGDPGGYGVFRAYFEQYKNKNTFVKQGYCISYDLAPVLDYKVLAYFPAKVLEIIDVFDSVTDPHRKYRRAMSTEEALDMMREEFIIKHPKLDIILFDIFANFAMEAPDVWQPHKANTIIQKSLQESGLFHGQSNDSPFRRGL